VHQNRADRLAKQDCTNLLEPSKTPDEYMRAVLAEYERLNVTAVVMGDRKSVRKWKDAVPGRIIPGTSFDNGTGGGKYVPVEQLRTAFTKDGFQVMGEVGLQYQGLSPSDPSVDAHFALAEELDIPVGIHIRTGGSDDRSVTHSSPGQRLRVRRCCWAHLELPVEGGP